MLVEMLLQGFIGVVDTQLFKGVNLEGFKSENIENANVRRLFLGATARSAASLFRVDALIDDPDNIIEVGPVNTLDEGLAGLVGLTRVEFLGNVPLAEEEDTAGEGGGELFVGYAEEGGNGEGGLVLVEDAGFAAIGFGEGHVSGVEDGDDEAHYVTDHAGGESHDGHSIHHLNMHIHITNHIPPIIRPTLIHQCKILQLHIPQKVLIPIVLTGTFQKLIKDVKVTFPLRLMNQSNFFQKIRIDGSAR
mmetsp:Transcript_2966/g.5529  ORF Transcript_2966/g.5529 Transcript_2966/m.5529 type:complete len:248 (-) Transcript_2966:176-919(-)